MKILSAILVVLLLSSCATFAPQKIEPNKIELYTVIDGKTTPDIIKQIDAIDNSGQKTLLLDLNSPGGTIPYGVKIMNRLELFKQHGGVVTTRVKKGKICASLCTAVFTSGDIRLAHPRSIWLFHAPFFTPVSPIPLSKEEIASNEKRLYVWKEWFYMHVQTVDPKFADYMKSNDIIFKEGDYIYSGIALHLIAPTYLTLLPNKP